MEKKAGDIAVDCQKTGYLDNKGLVGSRFQPMTFGNVLFGGLIGVVVDASSGAATEYEPKVTLRLVPAEFSSATNRDAFFDRLRAEFVGESKKVKERISRLCQGEQCSRQLRAADEEEAKGLQRLEHQRETALIKGV